MREIECDLSRIIINESQDGQVVWLQEKGGSRAFAIVVGFFEASSLRDRVREFVPPRPMTHHLVMTRTRDLGGVLERIVITELKNNTYFARLMVRQGKDIVEIDSRPSDALVLSVQEKCPIYVSEDVLNEASKWSAAPQVSVGTEELELPEEPDFEEGEEEEDLEEGEEGDEEEDEDEGKWT
jgi:hypothetical protein